MTMEKQTRKSSPRKDLTNQTFNDLTVIQQFECDIPNGVRRWECQCICGNRTVVKTSDLTTGKVKSCGCRKVSQIPPGSIFGKLTVRNATDKRASNGTIIYLCDCECGNTCEVPSSHLIKGDLVSYYKSDVFEDMSEKDCFELMQLANKYSDLCFCENNY
jgi:hypothetical protein